MNVAGVIIRLLALIAALLIATWISAIIRDELGMTVTAENEQMVQQMIILATIAFIILLAIPFVPGAEIGLAMLTLFGAEIAPIVYIATITGLMLAFMIGRFLPTATLVRALRFARLKRAAATVKASADLPMEERLTRLMEGGSPRTLRLATRFRYAAVLVAINLPGNFLIGGGGGIAMMAGMSGLFRPLQFLLAVAIAVAPMPLAVMIFGA